MNEQTPGKVSPRSDGYRTRKDPSEEQPGCDCGEAPFSGPIEEPVKYRRPDFRASEKASKKSFVVEEFAGGHAEKHDEHRGEYTLESELHVPHLNSVVGLVPLEKLGQPLFDRGVGVEIEIFFKIVDIGESVGNVAGLHALHLEFGGSACHFF